MNLVDYAISDAVATITLNRPPVNALNAELISDIGSALTAAAVLWLGNSALADPDYTQLIVFGDSLADGQRRGISGRAERAAAHRSRLRAK